MGRLWSFHLRLVWPSQVNWVENEIVDLLIQFDFLTAGKNLVTTVLFIPFCYRRILVHVLDDVSPSYACIISTEGNLTLLSAVGNNAHFRATEVVVEEVLKPH